MKNTIFRYDIHTKTGKLETAGKKIDINLNPAKKTSGTFSAVQNIGGKSIFIGGYGIDLI